MYLKQQQQQKEKLKMLIKHYCESVMYFKKLTTLSLSLPSHRNYLIHIRWYWGQLWFDEGSWIFFFCAFWKICFNWNSWKLPLKTGEQACISRRKMPMNINAWKITRCLWGKRKRWRADKDDELRSFAWISFAVDLMVLASRMVCRRSGLGYANWFDF